MIASKQHPNKKSVCFARCMQLINQKLLLNILIFEQMHVFLSTLSLRVQMTDGFGKALLYLKRAESA